MLEPMINIIVNGKLLLVAQFELKIQSGHWIVGSINDQT